MNTIISTPHRLPLEIYSGPRAVSFVLCIKDRKHIFDNAEIFRQCEGILLKELKKYRCDALVYLCMPDHCHLLLKGNDKDSRLLAVIKGFKQKTGFRFGQYFQEVRWQKRFYDHVLGKTEE